MSSVTSASILLIRIPSFTLDPKLTPNFAPAVVPTSISTLLLPPTSALDLCMFMDPEKSDIVPRHSSPFLYTQPKYE